MQGANTLSLIEKAVLKEKSAKNLLRRGNNVMDEVNAATNEVGVPMDRADVSTNKIEESVSGLEAFSDIRQGFTNKFVCDNKFNCDFIELVEESRQSDRDEYYNRCDNDTSIRNAHVTTRS